MQRLRSCFLPLLALGLGAAARAQSTAYTLEGTSAGNVYGTSAAALGDVDQDGYDDFIVGSPGVNAPNADMGRVYVYSGKDRHALYSWAGTSANEQLGFAVAAAGDMDLDGFPDILIGAPGAVSGGQAVGKVLLRSGKDGIVLRTWTGITDGGRFGHAIAVAGDADLDGMPEVVVGAPLEYSPDYDVHGGAVHVYSGATGTQISSRVSWVDGVAYGWSVAGCGDLTGDGRAEFVVGVPGWYGSGEVILRQAFDGSYVDSVSSPIAGERLGASVSNVGDTDGDGTVDFLVGAPADGAGGAGRAFVISGATWTQTWTTQGPPASNLGASVARIGDVDGDGRPDYAIGAPTASLGLLGQVGAVYVKSGANGGLLHTLYGTSAGCRFGHAITGGDFNGDGTPDGLVGAPYDGPNGVNSGSARVVLMNDAAGTPFCFGDGSGTACPCNPSSIGARAGCPNSVGGAGKLVALGSAHISNDTVALHGTGMTNSSCLYYQGTAQVAGGAGALFADGLRCVSGTIRRLGIRSNVFGGSYLPVNGGTPLSVAGGAQAGQTLHYQVWYRDNGLLFCTLATNNVTNGVSIEWLP